MKTDKLIKKFERLYNEVKRQPQRGRSNTELIVEFIEAKEELDKRTPLEQRKRFEKMYKRALQ